MRLYLLTLLIPFGAFGADFCTDAGRILVDYEKELSKAKIQKCSEVKVADLLQGHVGLEGATFLEKKKCNTLASIESELERLKAELSVLNGIQKLKNTVAASKTEAGKGVRQAGMTFVASLNTAQSLEVLLETSTFDQDRSKNGIPFIQKLKELPEEKRKNQLDLSNAIKELCKNRAANDKDACDPKLFSPSPEAVNEILKLIESSKEVTPVQVELWKSQLAIQKANGQELAPWSFTQMQDELKDAFLAIDNGQVMSRDHLNAIKKLDNFKSVPQFEFVKDIAAVRDINKAKIMSDKLLVLLGDAKLRQEYEAQSKLSVVVANNQALVNRLPPEKQSLCRNSKQLFNEARACHAALAEEAAKNSTDAELKETLLPSIKASMDYAISLGRTETDCKNKLVQDKTTVIPESCYKDLDATPVDLQQEIRQLNILKEKIGSENQEKMTLRNFALKKWGEKCGPVHSTMDQCDLTEDFAISKTAMMAVKDSLEVAVVFTPKPESEEKAKELCEEGEEKVKSKLYRDTLCSLFTSTPVVIQTNNVPTPSGPVEEKYDPVAAQNRDRMIVAGRGLLTDTLREIMNYKFNQPAPMGVNPYMYNYAPYNYGAPPMGIADSIMFNARYYGAYGFYMPTPGYQPYTAFGSSSSMTAYRPAATVYPSRYFGK